MIYMDRIRQIKKYFTFLIIMVILNSVLLSNAEGATNMKGKAAYRERLEKIDISNGVGEKEAIVIAQNYLIDEKLDGNCIIFWPKVKESFLYDSAWTISFPPSIKVIFNTPFSFQVHIDKKTGKVISAGWNK